MTKSKRVEAQISKIWASKLSKIRIKKASKVPNVWMGGSQTGFGKYLNSNRILGFIRSLCKGLYGDYTPKIKVI